MPKPVRGLPGCRTPQGQRPALFGLFRFDYTSLAGYDYDTGCAAAKRNGYRRNTQPQRASFAKPLSNCESAATKSKHSSAPLTRPDGFIAGVNDRASKWISTSPSTAA